MDTWREMIRAQGGDPDAAMPTPKESHVVTAERSGILVRQDALPFGIGAVIGGVGVSGAPGGEKDEVCANAGIAKVADALK